MLARPSRTALAARASRCAGFSPRQLGPRRVRVLAQKPLPGRRRGVDLARSPVRLGRAEQGLGSVRIARRPLDQLFERERSLPRAARPKQAFPAKAEDLRLEATVRL